jgi:hypothetical protein
MSHKTKGLVLCAFCSRLALHSRNRFHNVFIEIVMKRPKRHFFLFGLIWSALPSNNPFLNWHAMYTQTVLNPPP